MRPPTICLIAATLGCTALVAHCTTGNQDDPLCTGTPTPCDQLAAADCDGQLGCHLGSGCAGESTCGPADSTGSCTDLHCYGVLESCDGTAAVCDVITYDALCDAQPSCQWNVAASSCDGSDFACADNVTKDMCDLQPACQAAVLCEPGDCSLRNDFSCQITPGCSLVETCSGDASACEEIQTASACSAQQGCVRN